MTISEEAVISIYDVFKLITVSIAHTVSPKDYSSHLTLIGIIDKRA